MGVGGMLDQMKIRLTQPQVELEYGNKSVPKIPVLQEIKDSGDLGEFPILKDLQMPKQILKFRNS